MSYGWLIKHQATGAYCIVAPDGSVSVNPDPEKATMYPTRGEALAEIVAQQSKSTTFPDCDLVDYTKRPELIPDADTPQVRTREEVLAEAKAAGADRRKAHAAARAEFRAQPSAVLIQKPVTNAKSS